MAHTTSASSFWSLDYTQVTPSTSKSMLDPPGHVAPSSLKSSAPSALIQTSDLSGLRQQKAWEIALAPAKNVPMQGEQLVHLQESLNGCSSNLRVSARSFLPAFMMYMTGGGVQIFSVMSVWFLLKGAVQGIFSVQQVFAPFASKPTTTGTSTPFGPSLLNQKAVFVLCQIGLLGVGLWKCNSMGLLPTHQSDWLAFTEPMKWEPL
ncbi:BQ2448_7307 [Microbotryum intermedium]|uniref:ER membrane protein complex subunit 4 n=1 Tax=Microbotryum intermedium TaxID=269621 RepID=A0A238FMK4_9BASI|nr:BQ2448_7307 [Microbotryum intermedium]